MAGFFLPIIPRNSTVPTSRVEDIYPIHEDQQYVDIIIYQGESPTIDKNIKLGAIEIQLPPKSVQDRGVDVRFTYDINGLLQVEATVRSTKTTKELIIQQNACSMSDQEIRARLAALNSLKIHPRDKQENALLLARITRLYEEYLEHRTTLQHWLVEFHKALDSQDDALIVSARKDLTSALDEFENYLN